MSDGDRGRDPLLEVLGRYWGYSTFRPLQREAMDAILQDRDSVVVLPTGGGKSLCFQAPALVREGLAVVVSPLISLMKDQVDTLTGNGVPAACINSAQPADERAAVLHGVREGRYRLLYVSPERMASEGPGGFAAGLARLPISFVAVDEAHCISQWGHDFRPEYRQLGRLRSLLPGVGLHAYTATATERVRRDIAAELALRNPLELVGSFDRPNLIYRVLARANLKRQIQDILARHPGQAGIVYCTSRREVDALAAWLSAIGLRSRAYHAGLPDDERARNQDAFLEERCRRRRGHGGLRDGHRPVGRAVRRPRRRPAVPRALPAGVGPRRARRARSRMRAHRLAGRLSQVARDARAQRRADRSPPRAARRHGAVRRVGGLPPPASGVVLRRAVRTSGLRGV
jgi:superfamily II DNA helicase RecQ